MIEIRRIKPDEWLAAKRVVYRVAHTVFNDPRPLEESIAYYESQHELKDMDNIQMNYFGNGGVFLVMMVDDEMIGTGALRKLDDGICELKRVWFLHEYQGQGLGYRMIMELLNIARAMGYRKIRLETAPMHQVRAYTLYKRLGFYEIPRYDSSNEDEMAMEMEL